MTHALALKRPQNYAINALRTIAAVFVVFEHVRAMFFRDYSDVEHSPVAAVFYFGTALGNEAVMVFFVLSGFWVGMSVLKDYDLDRFNWVSYAIRRLTRLWIVLIPAIALTAVCVYVGLALFPDSGPYTGNPAYHDLAPADLADRSGWVDALGNVFFVQTLHVPVFGTNSPLWSLAYEFWYYALFPLLLAVFVKGSSTLTRVGSAVAIVAVSILVGPTVLAYFAVWLLGAALAFWKDHVGAFMLARSTWVRSAMCWSAVALLGISLVVHQAKLVPAPIAVALLSAATALLIATLINDFSDGGWPRRLAGPVHRYADVSYTLYLTHAPLLLLFTAAALPDPDNRWGPGILSYLGFAAIVAVLMLIGWLIGAVTEKRTESVRVLVQSVVARAVPGQGTHR